VNHIGHPNRLRRDGLCLVAIAGSELNKPEETGLNIEDRAGRNHVGLVEVQAGEGAVVVDVALGNGLRKSVGRSVFVAVKLGEEGVELILLAEAVVPPNDRLVVPVATRVAGVEVVARDSRSTLPTVFGAGRYERILVAIGLMRLNGMTLPGNWLRQYCDPKEPLQGSVEAAPLPAVQGWVVKGS